VLESVGILRQILALVTEELACGCANLARKCDGRQAAGGFKNGWHKGLA